MLNKIIKNKPNEDEINVKVLDKKIIVPLKDVVLFPGVIVPIFIGRENSIKSVNLSMKKTSEVVFVSQRNPSKEFINPRDVFSVGVSGVVLETITMPDGILKLLIEGKQRVKLSSIVKDDGILKANVEAIEDAYSPDSIDLLKVSVLNSFKRLSKYKKISEDIVSSLRNIKDTNLIIDALMLHLNMNIEEKQAVLELNNNEKRFEKLYVAIEKEVDLMIVDQKIKFRVKNQIDKNQKEFYLNEQIKAIQKELGDDENELNGFEKKLKEIKLPKKDEEKIRREISKLKRTPAMAAESTVIRNYLDVVLNLPWNKKSSVKVNLKEAEDILDKEHYALDKVKERILEHLAVQKRTGKVKGNILCLVGPPGVGKTSLGKVIAKAVGREFVRVSLGGVRDEAEIRGHRKTYIGAMPGRIIQSIKKAGVSNPLMLLDEIDKMGQDWKGDPASAMLEVLDPEQNNTFNDHYLDMDYDLSNIMFITTANSYNIPKPLLDRMEIINVSGYTEDEKLNIAKRHLLPKFAEEVGLKDGEANITDDAIVELIRHYTSESGVRNLSRELSSLLRKVVKDIDSGDKKYSHGETINADDVKKFLGVKKFEHEMLEDDDMVGVVKGMAWTSVGGSLLSIEAVNMAGKGSCILTGKLGDVMKESMQASYSYVKANAKKLGINEKIFEKIDIHVHVPEGATPKDGPSAGITIFTAIVSMLQGKKVRRDVSMTGEITLRGRVLAIGGLKEKMLAALRAGIKTVVIPADNIKDLEEIPENVKNSLEIIPVKNAMEVLDVVFAK